MRCNIVILETRIGTGSILSALCRNLDARRHPCIVSLAEMTGSQSSITLADLYDWAATEAEEFLESRLRDIGDDIFVCLIDDDFSAQYTPITAGERYDAKKAANDHQRAIGSVIGQLVLTFPEFSWRVATNEADLTAVLQLPRGAEIALFDSLGVANRVRECVNAVPKSHTLALRCSTAVVLEDEIDYALLHAYAAYRFGFKVRVVTRREQALTLFGKEGSPPQDFVLTLEDIMLNFPDRGSDPDEHLSRVNTDEPGSRQYLLPQLRRAVHRIFVSTSYDDETIEVEKRRTQFFNFWVEGSPFAHGYEGAASIDRVGKPTAGLFDLWQKAGLTKKLRWVDSKNIRITGVGRGYMQSQSGAAEKDGGHSAPGRILQVATRLLRRAERTSTTEHATLATCIHGAVLASNAFELLGGKTPTTALTALTLKHECELKAECQFAGTNEDVAIAERLEEISREIKSIDPSRKRSPSQRPTAAQYSAEMFVLNRLLPVLVTYNQFDEEEVVRANMRDLIPKMKFAGNPDRRVFEAVTWYFNTSVKTLWFLPCAIAGWILIFAFGFYLVAPEKVSFAQSLADSVTTFLSLQPPADDDLWKPVHGINFSFILVIFAIIAGFVHLGILISFVYSKITRK